jgi:hypothetical protein
MIRRLFDLLLLILLLVGGYQAWSTGRERSRLQDEFHRLVMATGDFTVGDPTKIHILAIPTGEPLHFAWRIYLPPNHTFVKFRNRMWAGTDQGTKPVEFIGRVRFIEDHGIIKAYDFFKSGSKHVDEIGGMKLADFLRGRWDQLQVEQAGAQGLVAFDPKTPALILRVAMPPAMLAEARQKFPEEMDRFFDPDNLFSIVFRDRY